MKNNKGISLITLVITIVILIILTGITIYYGGMKNIDHADNVGAYTEALNVSDAIVSRAFFNRTNSTKYPFVGTPLTNANSVEVNGLQYGNGWYQLSPEEAVELDLENVIRTYIVNYSTGEVVSVLPILVDGEEYFALDDLKQVVGEDETQVSKDQYNVIKGMVPVRNINGRWIVVNSEDVNWYDYSAEKDMWANVMLIDELTVTGYTNEEIRNTPLVCLEGREVTYEGSMFVWIPRYSKDPTGNIVFSELYHDYTENGYTVSSAFKENGNVTGIWVSKYDAEIKY